MSISSIVRDREGFGGGRQTEVDPLHFYKSRNVCYNARVEHKDKVAVFKALGDSTRLRIFEFLCNCCCPVAVGEEGEVRPVDGPTVGEVCCNVLNSPKITSSVSFHLKELRQAGLVTMERRGKNMVCCVDPDTVAKVSAYFGDLGGWCRPESVEKDNDE